MPWVEDRIDELAVILPDMLGKLERMKADMLLALVSDTEVAAAVCRMAARQQAVSCLFGCQLDGQASIASI